MTAKALSVNPRQSYRRWMFTINNPIVESLPEDFIEKCDFVTYQLEKGEESNTPHFQGYLVLKTNPSNKNGRTLKWMKDNLSTQAHWDPCTYGRHEDSVAYCNKEDTRIAGPWTHGEWDPENKAGKAKGGEKNASKILAVKRMIDEGASDHEIWNNYFGEQLRYSKAFDRYRMTLKNTFRQHQTQGVWFYGPAHTGKSHRARALALKIDPEPYYLKLNNNNQWFDGMKPGCKCVVIEDFRGNAPISFMLTLLDHTPMNVETKGSMMPFAAEFVIFTSNSHPRDVYGQQSESKIPLEVLNAWHSRFEGSRGCIIEMKEVIKVPDQQPTVDTIQHIEAGILPFAPPFVDLTCDEEIDDEDNDEPDEVEREGFEAWDDEEHLASLGDHFCREDCIDQHFNEETGASQRNSHGGFRHTKVYCDCQEYPCDGAHLLAKLRRTDTSTLGLEKVKDKRWGSEPVQSKLKFSARQDKIPVNDDNDNDN